jgi:mannosyl-3-phosphoglycerate phosphatase family protein
MITPIPMSHPSPSTVVASSGGLVILTDVDGVLCDPETCSVADARAALEILAARKVPVVLCSERSAAELIWLQRALDIREPFICESGAALYIPRDYYCELTGMDENGTDWEVIEFGSPYAKVSAALRRVATSLQIPIRSVDDLDPDQQSCELDMAMSETEPAHCRQYDVRFRILPSDPHAAPRLFNAMRAAGYRCFSGPRYHHATGVRDGRAAIRLLVSLYRAYWDSLIVIGLGDDAADRGLLREVDVPIIVRNDGIDQSVLLRKVPTAYLTGATGPAGWREAILGAVEF